jgi:hypothetical protein
MTELKPCETIDDAISILKSVLVLNCDLDYYALLIWDAHTRMRDLLPDSVCLYLAFEGKKSAGKTTATRCACLLAHKGTMYSSVTPAALQKICESGVTLAIDEIDALAKSDDNIERILRTGNSWNAKISLCQKSGGDWSPIEVNIGGPKVFNYRGGIDDALGSRCYIISMPSTKDRYIIKQGFFLEETLRPVSKWLNESVKNAVMFGGFNSQRVNEQLKSSEFFDRWGKLGGELGRNVQQAAIMLLVSDILGWKLDEQIQKMMDSQTSEDQYEFEREIIANFYLMEKQKQTERQISGLNIPEMIKLSSEEVRINLNEQLKTKGQYDYSKKRFGALKKEFGWVKGINEKKDSNQKGKNYLFFDGTILESLGIAKKREEK